MPFRSKKKAANQKKRSANVASFQVETNRRKGYGYVDYTLVLLILLLLAFGLVMLFSTTSYIGTLRNNDPYLYLRPQMIYAALGLGIMAAASFVPYRWYKKLSFLIYLLALALSGIVLVAGTSENGSSRWLVIGSINFQPSEIAKIAAIFFVARIISDSPKTMRGIKGIVRCMIYMIPLVGLVAVENLSTAIIILGISVVMIFVANPKYRMWFALAGLGLVALFVLVNIGGGYRFDRIDRWIHPENAGYQTKQALYAIGSGGLFGKGLGESMQKTIVPEAKNDMIFSIICEELGLVGGALVIILFLLLTWRLILNALHCKTMYGSFVLTGIATHIALQFILNIAVATNSMPNTGITLPFFSYGGTALIITLAEMGVALNISRHTEAEIDGITD